jgi:hypothetical protein
MSEIYVEDREPSWQIVQVDRCMTCKHRIRGFKRNTLLCEKFSYLITQEDGFCKYHERTNHGMVHKKQ